MSAPLVRVARVRVTGNSDKWTRTRTRTSTRVCVNVALHQCDSDNTVSFGCLFSWYHVCRLSDRKGIGMWRVTVVFICRISPQNKQKQRVNRLTQRQVHLLQDILILSTTSVLNVYILTEKDSQMEKEKTVIEKMVSTTANAHYIYLLSFFNVCLFLLY